VLRGSVSEKIKGRGHDRLAAFGGGAARAKNFWLGFIRQAVAGGYLAIDIERYGGLRLTERGRAVRQGAEEFRYRDIPATGKATGKAGSSRQRRSAGGSTAAALEGVDAALFAHLKALRRDLAEERGVPAYVVFSDATLQDMCLLRPATRDGFAGVNGVGPKKLQDFADLFIAAIRDHEAHA
jgi:ATP-dependent DNA helicase RecQ